MSSIGTDGLLASPILNIVVPNSVTYTFPNAIGGDGGNTAKILIGGEGTVLVENLSGSPLGGYPGGTVSIRDGAILQVGGVDVLGSAIPSTISQATAPLITLIRGTYESIYAGSADQVAGIKTGAGASSQLVNLPFETTLTINLSV